MAKVKWWADGVQMAENTIDQVRKTASLPFIHKHIAVMPDAHLGKGSTVGTVIPTKGAIVPAAVGVDIGCGMMAVQLDMTADQLPDNLFGVRSAIEKAVPHGRTDNGGANDRGAWNDVPHGSAWHWQDLVPQYARIVEKHPKAKAYNTARHMGTLGTGNHFIELCVDTENMVWVMLHSGSRGPGNRIGSYFIEQARAEMERYHITPYLADQDLAYLVENTELFDDYVEAVDWAQEFAEANRMVMMDLTLRALWSELGLMARIIKKAVNCHHNYVQMENHFGANVWVTRKGAVSAREGQLGIIPGSMGAKSFIVSGKGNPASFHSCSHGAGRTMSRTEAKKTFTVEDHIRDTNGVECRKDADVIDETPAAYKSIDAVMAAQEDLVEVVHTLRQVVCVKG